MNSMIMLYNWYIMSNVDTLVGCYLEESKQNKNSSSLVVLSNIQANFWPEFAACLRHKNKTTSTQPVGSQGTRWSVYNQQRWSSHEWEMFDKAGRGIITWRELRYTT